MTNDTDYGSRMRRIYTALGLLAAGATALVFAAADADASERRKPKPRPAIAKSHSDAAARSSSGGNEFSNRTDGDSNVGVMYAAPAFSSAFGADIFDGTATTGESVGFPIIGGGVSSQGIKPTYGLRLSPELRAAFGWAFYTNLDDATTRAMWAVELGRNVSSFDVEQGKHDQAILRSAICTDDELKAMAEHQNINCDEVGIN